MPRARLRFSAYPAASRPRFFRDVLEATERTLRLYDPTRRDNAVRHLVSVGVGSAVFVAYILLVPLLISAFIPSYTVFAVVIWFVFTVGFFAMMYYSAKLSDSLGLSLELGLTMRRADRTFLVHVRHVKPTKSRVVQLLRLVGDRKDEWFCVNVSGPDLAEGLKLAKEEIKIVLG